jgi:hypothetical protein
MSVSTASRKGTTKKCCKCGNCYQTIHIKGVKKSTNLSNRQTLSSNGACNNKGKIKWTCTLTNKAEFDFTRCGDDKIQNAIWKCKAVPTWDPPSADPCCKCTLEMIQARKLVLDLYPEETLETPLSWQEQPIDTCPSKCLGIDGGKCYKAATPQRPALHGTSVDVTATYTCP